MCHMKALHRGARSAGPIKAKPKIPKKEQVQPRSEAHPCDDTPKKPKELDPRERERERER